MGLECGDPQNRSGSLLGWQGRAFRHIHPIPRPVTCAPRPWPLPSTPGLPGGAEAVLEDWALGPASPTGCYLTGTSWKEVAPCHLP